MKQKNLLVIVVIVLLVVIGGAVLAVHGSKDKTTSTSTTTSSTASSDTSSATATNAVAIQNYMFVPMQIKVKVGTKVTWTNQDSVHHNVVPDDISKLDFTGPLIDKGQTYSYTFTKAGTYSYHCGVHPNMVATVVVTD